MHVKYIHLRIENDILIIPKLRAYCTFKENYETELFVYEVHNMAHISLLTQFRCGIFLLKIATGRYTQIPLEFKLCILYDSNLVEKKSLFFNVIFIIF